MTELLAGMAARKPGRTRLHAAAIHHKLEVFLGFHQCHRLGVVMASQLETIADQQLFLGAIITAILSEMLEDCRPQVFGLPT